VLVHVGLFVAITRSEAPLPSKKTAIRIVDNKPKPVDKTPELKPAHAVAAPEPPPPPEPVKPKPKPKSEPAAKPSDGPPPSAAPPLDLSSMPFTNDNGSGPSVSPDSVGRDPNEPKPTPRPVDKTVDPKAKAEPAACTEELVKATATTKVAIDYPAAAREQGLEGQLVLRAHIAADGTVGEVEVVRSVGPLIDEPAVAALKKWTFAPATKCGKAIESTFTIARRFEIGT
jgi:protein TonB